MSPPPWGRRTTEIDDSYYWAPLLFRLMADGVVNETWSAEKRRWTWALADEAVAVVDAESGRPGPVRG